MERTSSACATRDIKYSCEHEKVRKKINKLIKISLHLYYGHSSLQHIDTYFPIIANVNDIVQPTFMHFSL